MQNWLYATISIYSVIKDTRVNSQKNVKSTMGPLPRIRRRIHQYLYSHYNAFELPRLSKLNEHAASDVYVLQPVRKPLLACTCFEPALHKLRSWTDFIIYSIRSVYLIHWLLDIVINIHGPKLPQLTTQRIHANSTFIVAMMTVTTIVHSVFDWWWNVYIIGRMISTSYCLWYIWHAWSHMLWSDGTILKHLFKAKRY